LVNQQIDQCAVTEDWLTSLRGLASYTLPKVDVLPEKGFHVGRARPGLRDHDLPPVVE